MYQSPLSPLLFEPFLRDLKTELGYPIDIGKLKQLIEWSSSEYAQKGTLPLERVFRICRALYLQDAKEHEQIFAALFDKHVQAMDAWCSEFVEQRSTADKEKGKEPSGSNRKQAADLEKQVGSPKNTENAQKQGETEQNGEYAKQGIGPTPSDSPNRSVDKMDEPADEKVEKNAKPFKYLNMELVAEGESTREGKGQFALNEAFLPISKREIAHAWRYLRVKDGSRESNLLDVPATVMHIAKNRIPDRLVFQREPVNGEDLLAIFVDRGGSMTPFHYLSDAIIKVAREDGGHKRAKVYYYYNVPTDCVYEEPTLTKPVSLSKVYAELNPARTTVLIISDGGAVRGRNNEIRLKKTIAFLNGSADGKGLAGLQKRARFVAWLNPMPLHRWYGTTVIDTLRYSDIPIFSVLDMGEESLLQAVHTLMGKL